MGTPGTGSVSYIQIGKETTFGTKVAATNKLEVITCDVAPILGVIDDPSLYNQASPRGIYQGGQTFEGKMKLRLNYEGMLKLFLGVLGTVADAGPTDSAYTHTFKEAVALPSFTIEMIEGNIASGTCQVLVGAMITDMTISGKAGMGADGMLTAEISILAKDKQIGGTPTAALNFPAVWPVLFHQAQTVTDGSGDAAGSIRVRDFELMIKNALAKDRFYLGSVNIDQPVRNNFLDIRWKFTKEFQTVSDLTKAKAFTSAVLELMFQNPTLIGTSSKRQVDLKSSSATIVTYSNPISGYGIILQQEEWDTVYNVSDASALVVTIQNSETAT